MARYIRQRPPSWFIVVVVVLALWGVMGCYACLQQFRLGAEAMGPATAYDRALYASLPPWYNWVYAVAVGSALIGAIALLMRSAAARGLFIVSLLAVIVQFGFLFATTDIIAHKGAAVVLPFPALITAVALFEVWFAGYSIRRGWIS